MKRILSLVLGSVMFSTPAFVFADTSMQLGPTLAQRLTALAALQAQASSIQNGRALACSALFSASTVKAGEPVAVAWGSVGALDPATASSSIPMWPQDGGNLVYIQQPGTWTYSFTFYGVSGGSVTCDAKVVVTK